MYHKTAKHQQRIQQGYSSDLTSLVLCSLVVIGLSHLIVVLKLMSLISKALPNNSTVASKFTTSGTTAISNRHFRSQQKVTLMQPSLRIQYFLWNSAIRIFSCQR